MSDETQPLATESTEASSDEGAAVGSSLTGDIDEVPAAPETTPLRPATFWESGEGIASLDDPTPFGQENALQKLGRPPFEKSAHSKFRLLGYLATVYEHVATDVGE